MDTDTESSGVADEQACGTVIIAIQSDGAVSYASYQNHIPAVHSIAVENQADVDLRDVEVVVTCTPDFAEPIRYRYELLHAGERRVIQPVAFKLRHRYLAELTESENGNIRVEVLSGGTSQAEVSAPVTVLAFDQWGGTRSVPELLAAFCTPNHPRIDRFISEAAELLARSSNGDVMNGYDAKSRDVVWAQISAIFSAIARRRVQYSMPPASFAGDGQKIRTADRITDGGVATCLDLAMLMASCLEQANLNPLILLKDGHTWVGCWLVNTSFNTCLMDDALAVRKRIDAGELLAIEATHLTHERPSLRRAHEAGYAHLSADAADFRYAIDVRRARLERIKPLPSRGTVNLDARPLSDADLTVEAAPQLPPLISEPILLETEPVAETPEGRLGRWQSKLLDLTLRNRLLNFKPSKVMVPLTIPDPALLEDTLSDGREWRFRPRPEVMEGADPRALGLARARDGVDPLEQMARDAMGRHELLVAMDAARLDKALYEILLTVRNAQEETGANTLFLALGFLRWAEDERAEKTYLAPLLLVPVTLKRANARTGFSLVRHDDDAIVNPTLLQALRENHGIVLKGLDPPPADAHGIDVGRVFAIFRETVKEMTKWEVIADVYLGVFSFHKFVMYSDLRNRKEDLRKSKIVSHLIDRPGESMGASDLGNWRDIDDTHGPGELLAPMSADSSQMNALRRANEGYDFVLEGPPGTGKSQTITNLIADALAKGKKVLFVSEKMAALSVVERRLNEVGLGPFCLQLHSSKAVKIEVVRQLKATLDMGATRSPAAWDREVEKLTRLRNELNGLVKALHTEHSNGLTVRQALDTAIKYRHWPAIAISLPSAEGLDARALDDLRDKAREMREVANELGDLATHALRPIRHVDWSNAWEDSLLNSSVALLSAMAGVRAAAATLEQALTLRLKQPSPKMLADVEVLAEVLLQAPSVPSSFARIADNAGARRKIADLRGHGERRNLAWRNLSGTLKPEVARLQAIELEDAWAIAASKWALPRWLGERAVAARFIPYTLTGKAPPSSEVSNLIGHLRELNAEDLALSAADAGARDLLSERYQALETDWAATKRFEEWGVKLEIALNRFADPDRPEARQALAQRVRLLVSEHQSLLDGNGDLARRLVNFRTSYRRFMDALSATAKLAANAELLDTEPENTNALDLLAATLGSWREHRPALRTWCLWNGLRAKAASHGIVDVFAAVERGVVKNSQIADYIEYCYQTWWLKAVMDRDDALRTFSGAVHSQKIRDFREADARFQGLTRELIVARLCAGLPSGGQRTSPEMGVLTRETTKQRAHIPIRKLVQATPTLLPALKPCLLMSPLSVAQYLDPSYPRFDLVIFDEASQIPVWDAVGVIARGKQAVIVGDPKQLPPTAFFDRGEDEETAIDIAESAPPQDLQSILDECMASGMSRLSLDWHYRSAHESLIAFSNMRYYSSRLITFPSPVTQDTSVRLHQVNGIYDRGASQTNRKEAEAVVARIVQHFGQEDATGREKTVGVVTFNSKQMRLIDELLNAAMAKDPGLEERIGAHGDERLFIKNLENVQGDERDIILFSTTFGKDAAGRLSMNFGPINQEGGERRLNVAVTRARQAIEIFSSLRPDDINLANTRAAGVADLKAYLHYALVGPSALAMEASPTGRDPDSPFEMEVIEVLREAGWTVHPQVGCSGYRIDIGVVDRGAPGRYLMAVECDGASYHGMPSARDRDRLRQSILEGLGWKMARVWSTDWWADRARTRAALIKAVTQAQTEADTQRDSREVVLGA